MPRFRVTTTETVQVIARYYVDAADADAATRRVQDRYCRPHTVEERGDKDAIAYAVEASEIDDRTLLSLGKPAIATEAP